MHTLKLLLDTTKADEVFISSVFDAIAKVHNILVAEGKKRLRMLKRDKRYKYAREHYGKAAAAAANWTRSSSHYGRSWMTRKTWIKRRSGS